MKIAFMTTKSSVARSRYSFESCVENMSSDCDESNGVFTGSHMSCQPETRGPCCGL